MQDVERSRVLAVFLGASRFPYAPNLAYGRAFSNSAADVEQYLLAEQGLGISRQDVLWLFDDSRSPSEQLNEIINFLLRTQDLKNERSRPRDLLIYYVGHGLFNRGDQAYCLAVRSTYENNEGATSIRASDLAAIIREKAAFLRRYLILDCCFAASIHKEFQSGALTAARVQIEKELPPGRGTAVLCSSSSRDVSRAPEVLDHTMFSHALIQVLRSGHEARGSRLSFSDLCYLIIENLRSAYPDDYVRPEVHSPDQREGNIADFPLFPNPAFRKQAVGERIARAGRQVVAKRTSRKTEKEQVAAAEAPAHARAEAEEKERRAKNEETERAKKQAKTERLVCQKAEQEQKAKTEPSAREPSLKETIARQELEEQKPLREVQPIREQAKPQHPPKPRKEQHQFSGKQVETDRGRLTAVKICISLAIAAALGVFFWTTRKSPAVTATSQSATISQTVGHAKKLDLTSLKGFAKPKWQDVVVSQGTPIEIELVRTIKEQGRNRTVESIAFSSDGRFLASTSEEREQPSTTSGENRPVGNGSVQLWDVESGALVRVSPFLVGAFSADRMRSVAFSSDGRLYAASGSAVTSPPSSSKPWLENRSQNVQIWETSSGGRLKNFQTKEWQYGFDQLAFSVDGRFLAGASDETVPIWDLASGTLVRKLSHPNTAVALAFQPRTHVLAVADNDQRQGVLLWDVDDGPFLRSLHSEPPSYGSAVAFSPDGRSLATGHVNGRLHIWDANTHAIIRSLRPADRSDVGSVAFSPDGRILASVVRVVSGDVYAGFELQLWNPGTGEHLSLSTNPDPISSSLALDPAEPLIAVVGSDGIEVWKLKASPR